MCISLWQSCLLLAVSPCDVAAAAEESRVLCCWHHGKITSPSFNPTGELPLHSALRPRLPWLINTPPSLLTPLYKPPEPQLIFSYTSYEPPSMTWFYFSRGAKSREGKSSISDPPPVYKAAKLYSFWQIEPKKGKCCVLPRIKQKIANLK